MQPGMGQEPMMEFGKPKKSKAPIVAGICVVLALAGVGFGVFEMMQDKGKSLDDLKIEIENSDGTKTELETDKITISDDGNVITIKDSKSGDYTIYRSLVNKYVEWTWNGGDQEMVENALSGDIDNPNYMAYVATGSTKGLKIFISEDSDMISTSLEYAISNYFEKTMELPANLGFRCAGWQKDDSNKYIYMPGGCGGVGAYYSVFDVIDAEETGETLKVTISYGHIQGGPLGSDDGKWHLKLLKGKDVVKEADVESDGMSLGENEDNNELVGYFYEHPDEFDHYTLTFKKENKRYLLSSSSKTE